MSWVDGFYLDEVKEVRDSSTVFHPTQHHRGVLCTQMYTTWVRHNSLCWFRRSACIASSKNVATHPSHYIFPRGIIYMVDISRFLREKADSPAVALFLLTAAIPKLSKADDESN